VAREQIYDYMNDSWCAYFKVLIYLWLCL